MPIPERLKLQPVPAALFAHMCELCDAIEDADEWECESLLAQWHEHAQRRYEAREFETYWRSTDKASFVRGALYPKPTFDDALQYAEVLAVYEYVVSAKGAEDETSYYLAWLEAQFPNSEILQLIYWPDEWFGDPSLFRDADGAFTPEATLSAGQVLAYAMAKSSRQLAGAPGLVLPFPLP